MISTKIIYIFSSNELATKFVVGAIYFYFFIDLMVEWTETIKMTAINHR